VGVGLTRSDGDGDGVRVRVAVGDTAVGVGDGVAVVVPRIGVGVRVGVSVAVRVLLWVGVPVGDGVGVTVRVGVGVLGMFVCVGVTDEDGPAVAVRVAVGVVVAVGVAASVGVDVAVGVALAAGMGTATQAENSEVLLAGSVAVAVIACPPATATGSVALKGALPVPSVATVMAPRNACPSPWPDASHAALEKNSMLKPGVLGVLSRDPSIVVLLAPAVTDERTGKFCRLFAPVSRSWGSLSVTPLGPRSIPSPAFA
jgi:hypothetical protein